MKVRLEREKESHGNDINTNQAKTWTKFKMCLSMMMIMCNKQHLSNT